MRASVERDETTMKAGKVCRPAPLLPPTDVHLQTQDSDRCPDLVGRRLSTAPAHQPACTTEIHRNSSSL